MKKTSLWLSVLFATLTAQGQEFVLQGGSTGADGPLDVAEDTTLSLPPDGIFNYTTITVAEGVTLRFERNALNTPVYLLATGDVVINGNIDIAGRSGSGLAGGKGGPGGYDGGRPGFTEASPPGAGLGPGAGKGGTLEDTTQAGAGSGAFRSIPVQTESLSNAGPGSSGYSNNHGTVYGNALLRPLIGGSGGGGAAGSPGVGGGGGGGALLIGSPTRVTLNGQIDAQGGASANTRSVDNGGSGGAVRIVAPVLEGSGSITVFGGNNKSAFDSRTNHAGHGRIRVDAFELEGATGMNFSPSASLSAGSSVFVFPANRPAIDIVSAAGNEIAPGTLGPVRLNLPFDAPTTQTVTLRASNFGGVVPVSVVVTPAHGTPQEFQAEIDNGAANPAEVDVAIEVPTNVQVTLQVWSR